MTSPANGLPILCEVHSIVCRKRMPFTTMCHSPRAIMDDVMFMRGKRLEMPRITAWRIFTQVMQNMTLRNGTNQNLISKSMCSITLPNLKSPPNLILSMPRSITSTLPCPAAVWHMFYIQEKSFDSQWGGDILYIRHIHLLIRFMCSGVTEAHTSVYPVSLPFPAPRYKQKNPLSVYRKSS